MSSFIITMVASFDKSVLRVTKCVATSEFYTLRNEREGGEDVANSDSSGRRGGR